MDAGLSRAVREVFVRLYEEGLIYRGDYIVNWCPRCQTVLSDLEVEREERDAEFVYIKYGRVTLGHRAAGDEARRHRGRGPSRTTSATSITSGKTLERAVGGRHDHVQVVADEAVDPEFGTGVIKVTPGHDSDRLRDRASATTCRSAPSSASTAR